jgi:hypothetical protein
MWPDFDDALDQWLAASPLPVWLVGDFNEGPNPRGLHFRGRKQLMGIDGHVITGRLQWRLAARRLAWRTSDHRGVAALVRIPRLPRRNR